MASSTCLTLGSTRTNKPSAFGALRLFVMLQMIAADILRCLDLFFTWKWQGSDRRRVVTRRIGIDQRRCAQAHDPRVEPRFENADVLSHAESRGPQLPAAHREIDQRS